VNAMSEGQPAPEPGITLSQQKTYGHRTPYNAIPAPRLHIQASTRLSMVIPIKKAIPTMTWRNGFDVTKVER
jgi:hypothetical protein